MNKRDNLFTFADVFGVTLNGKAARLDLTKAGLLAVKSAVDRAVFNPSVAALVIRERKGAFITKEMRGVA